MATLQASFFSKSMRREVTFHALIPVDRPEIPGMPPVEARPMKALYLLNGYSGSCSDWITFSRIRELSDRGNVAVFMPSGENHFYVDDEDKGELHGEYVGNELVSFTRNLFPLSSDREDTMIGGLSMGGYGAIRNGLKYAHHFGRILALSSALLPYRIANAPPDYQDGVAGYNYFKRVFGDLDRLLGSDKDPEALVMRLKETNADMPQIYMACGTEDFLLDVNRRFHEFLNRENIVHTYKESAGAHTWEFWNGSIGPALQWALGDRVSV
ncbi:alpha/beta hydrolase [Paenibacillus flagellatus]|uniref:Acetylesterase n=1 Tax=Paenibacillus flagellatus TaxID=2211139 RepID=A0A2V5KE35_9BACL|nr:alpha/beta hydrolase-fold protein [Paenibacillus flagellatus]PYI52240.1 acetylesterase [Paenibacillus flagellatus]